MAAGLGFKTFTTGEVLTAADTNGYLMQGVLVFASAAARTSAITSPQEGQMCFLKDTNSTEYYDGAAWTSLVPASTSYDSVLTQEVATNYIQTRTGTGALAAVTSTTYYIPIFLPAFTADRIAMRTSTSAGGVSGNVRLGLYNSSSTTGRPTTVAFDAGTLVCSGAASTSFEITISQSISSGWYYLAINSNSGTHSLSGQAASAGNPYQNFTATAVNGNPLTYFTESSITGAFATAGTLTASSGVQPTLALRMT